MPLGGEPSTASIPDIKCPKTHRVTDAQRYHFHRNALNLRGNRFIAILFCNPNWMQRFRALFSFAIVFGAWEELFGEIPGYTGDTRI